MRIVQHKLRRPRKALRDLFSGKALWWAIPLAEAAVTAYAVASPRGRGTLV